MKRVRICSGFAVFTALAFGVSICHGQSGKGGGENTPVDATAQPASISTQPTEGPHGGTLRSVNDLQLETVVTQAGIQLYAFDRSGKALSVKDGRGTVSVTVEGNPKRYRYNLLPDGKGSLNVAVNLAAISGRQIEVDVQLVGVPGAGGAALKLHEVTTVPPGEKQLAAAAIALQKTCPVSGKQLGSMGDPIAVDVSGKKIFVCCVGCVSKVEEDPAKYAVGRPKVTVSVSTTADAALIAKQANCPVMDEPLGSMGNPVKVMVDGKPIFLCCKGCVKKVESEPAKYLAMVYTESTEKVVTSGGEEVRPGIFKVDTSDAPYITAQKKCPVMDEPLDSMGGPYKVNAAGKAIYICCPGCAKKIEAEPEKYLGLLAKQGVIAPVIR